MDTDEELVVRDREGSRNGKAGQVIACRLLPNGAGEWILSFAIEVPRARRSQLADLLRTSEQQDADFANWYSEAQKPPQMRTKQGYEVVLCSGTWKVSDPHAVMAKLEDAFGHAVDDRINWTDDEGSVLASFSRKGFELEVHTMSHELWEETVDVLIKGGARSEAAAQRCPARRRHDQR